jgi:hypothetical protein
MFDVGSPLSQVMAILTDDLYASRVAWREVQSVQLMHVTAAAHSREDILRCTRFMDYLLSGEDEDLPQLAGGVKFPDREWKIVADYLAARGNPMGERLLRNSRKLCEDHPKIREWEGKTFGWWEQDFGAEEFVKKLYLYSPWRREAS